MQSAMGARTAHALSVAASTAATDAQRVRSCNIDDWVLEQHKQAEAAVPDALHQAGLPLWNKAAGASVRSATTGRSCDSQPQAAEDRGSGSFKKGVSIAGAGPRKQRKAGPGAKRRARTAGSTLTTIEAFKSTLEGITLEEAKAPRFVDDKCAWYAKEVLAGMSPEKRQQLEELQANNQRRHVEGGDSDAGGQGRRSSGTSAAAPSGDGRTAHAPVQGYLHNDQTFAERYWREVPVPPAHVLLHGPFNYPRTQAAGLRPRGELNLDEFLADPGGGEGVAKLLKARDRAEESWGYEWLHTVLVLKGRSFPSLPGIILGVWTCAVTVALMVFCQFDQLQLEQFGVDDLQGIQKWQRDLFIYMQGLNVPNGMIGAAITFLLVFRVNISYERWWEGRRTFRDIVNHCRDMSRQIATHITDWHLAEKMLRWVIVTVHTLKRHVREESYVDELRGVVSDEALNFLESARNKPLAATQRLSELLATAISTGGLNCPDMGPNLDINISDLVNCIGTCEMILTTPMPFAYVAHLRTFILIYIALLPPLFCTYLGWLCPFATFLITVLFLGMDSISGEIENPFGYDWNDLPLDGIIAQLVSDIVQSMQMMLDLPINKGVVTFADVAKYNVSTFGADQVIQHLNDGGEAVAPIFPSESLFLRHFRRTVLQEAPSEDDEESEEGQEGGDDD